MRFILICALLVGGVLHAATPEAAIDTPVINDAPKAKTDITSKRTPTAEAPLFGTRDWFRNSFETPRKPLIQMRSPLRIEEYVVGGKVELSLRTYTELVLNNNTDIQTERLTIETSRNDILRQYYIFDPLAVASFSTLRNQAPSTLRTEGNSVLSTLSQPVRFTLGQMLPTGTNYNVTFNSNRLTTNSANSLLNPQFSSGLNVTLAQPLLRNRGMFVTKLPITVARNRLVADQFGLENRLLTLVQTAENAYWDVILARENLKVQEQALVLADTSLKRAQRELELGAISSLEIYQPQQQYASFEISVTQARYRLQQTEDALRRQISADLNPSVRDLPIVLTESIEAPVSPTLDRETLVQTSLRLRPDLKQRRQLVQTDDLQIRNTANFLRPDLSLTAQYGSNGQNLYYGYDPDLQLQRFFPGGISDSLGQAFGFTYPAYGFGLRLTLPIRDRRASADYADAVVSKRLDELRTRSAEQVARQEVLNAISSAESAKASVELAKVALDFAQKRVEADQKRYDLGTITLFFLLDSQNALTRAQSDLVGQSVQYRRSLLNLQRSTGELLGERGITIQ